MKIDTREGGHGVPEGFVELPPLVYQDDPRWIPEDPASVGGAFSPFNPWFATHRARAFSIPGKARAAGFRQAGLEIDGVPTAFFGYFESIGDPAAEAAILDAIADWARDAGAKRLYGPIQFATAIGYRLLVDAEPGALPFLGEPYNPPNYPAALARCGFREAERYYTQLVTIEQARAAAETKRGVLDRVLAAGYRIQTLDRTLWMDRLQDIYGLVDAVFGANFAYTPIPYENFVAMYARPAAARMCDRTSLIAFGPDGELAGIFLHYPHYGPLVVQGAGSNRIPIAALDCEKHRPLLERHRPRAAIMKTLGIAPAHRRRGLSDALFVATIDRSAGLYEVLYPALIRSDNFSGRFFAEKVSGERHYILYAKDL